MIGTAAYELFESAVRERIRTMTEDEFRAFVVETRPPDEPQLQETVK